MINQKSSEHQFCILEHGPNSLCSAVAAFFAHAVAARLLDSTEKRVNNKFNYHVFIKSSFLTWKHLLQMNNPRPCAWAAVSLTFFDKF